MPKMEIPRGLVRTIQLEYRCAGCWNNLSVRFDNTMSGDEVIVECGTEGCTTPGFVSERYVERRLEINRSEALEAKIVLSKSAELGWLRPKVSVSQALSELGF